MQANDLTMGMEVEVNLGMGKVFRPVDRVIHNEETGTVTIVLYSEIGKRPRLTVPMDTEVNTR